MKKIDYILIFLVGALSIVGIISIGSATHVYETLSNEFLSQCVWFLVGMLFMFLFSIIDYESIARLYIFIYILNIILLTVVIVIGSKSSNAVARWIRIGPIGLQPSEFAKIFVIIFLSSLLNKYRDIINKPFFLLIVFISIILPAFLIIKQPSLSAGIVVILITIFIMLAAGLNFSYVLYTTLTILPALIFIFFDVIRDKPILINKFLKEYQIKRIASLIKSSQYSESFYQTRQSMFAIGSGKLFGKGIYNGTVNRLNYLPESHNDFIFAVIGEEFGFVGCLITVFILFSIIYICICIARDSKSFLGKLIASGISGMFSFQSFLNIGVATGILPNTGVPLPFVSYGGSSMITNMIAIGMIINISINSYERHF
jgi:rod shape determining protein RodA